MEVSAILNKWIGQIYDILSGFKKRIETVEASNAEMKTGYEGMVKKVDDALAANTNTFNTMQNELTAQNTAIKSDIANATNEMKSTIAKLNDTVTANANAYKTQFSKDIDDTKQYIYSRLDTIKAQLTTDYTTKVSELKDANNADIQSIKDTVQSYERSIDAKVVDSVQALTEKISKETLERSVAMAELNSKVDLVLKAVLNKQSITADETPKTETTSEETAVEGSDK